MTLCLKIPPDPKVCALLEAARRRAPFEDPPSNNKTLQEFRSSPVPSSNIDRDGGMSTGPRLIGVDNLISAAGHLIGASTCTNAAVYPPGSIMGWHTNLDDPGTRTYYTYTEGRGIFRYYYDSQYYESEDNIGTWTARQFTIDPEKPLWHTIWTERVRYVFGFNTPARS